MVTADTSQDLIGPCGPLEQSGDLFRHVLMAVWSSALDFGAHPFFGVVLLFSTVWGSITEVARAVTCKLSAVLLCLVVLFLLFLPVVGAVLQKSHVQ